MVLSWRGKSTNDAQESVVELKKESSFDNVQKTLTVRVTEHKSNGVGTHSLALSFRMLISFSPAILLLKGKFSLRIWYSTSV